VDEPSQSAINTCGTPAHSRWQPLQYGPRGPPCPACAAAAKLGIVEMDNVEIRRAPYLHWHGASRRRSRVIWLLWAARRPRWRAL